MRSDRNSSSMIRVLKRSARCNNIMLQVTTHFCNNIMLQQKNSEQAEFDADRISIVGAYFAGAFFVGAYFANRT